MGKLKYSLIIPVYNSELYLKTCIDSVLSQPYKDYEIILVDDGSVDHSLEYCHQYAKEYSNIRVYHKENGGAASARNLGIEKAQGRYLIFIDADDSIESRFFEFLDEDIESTDMLIYGMSFDYYRGDSIIRQEPLSCIDHPLINVSDLSSEFDDLFSNNVFSSACNRVFSATIVRENQLRFKEDMKIYEDLDFVLQYMSHIQNLAFLNRVLYHYRIQEENTHLNYRIGNIETISIVIKRLKNSIKTLGKKYISKRDVVQVFDHILAFLFFQYLMNTKKLWRGSLETIRAINKLNLTPWLAGYKKKDIFVRLLLKKNHLLLGSWIIVKRIRRKIRLLVKKQANRC